MGDDGFLQLLVTGAVLFAVICGFIVVGQKLDHAQLRLEQCEAVK